MTNRHKAILPPVVVAILEKVVSKVAMRIRAPKLGARRKPGNPTEEKTGAMNMPKEMSMSKEPRMSKEMRMSNGHAGHLYMQTNEIQNAIIHYHRAANGTLTEVERCPHGRRRFRDVQADQRPGERAECLRGRGQRHPHAGSTVSVCDQWRRQFGLQLPRRRRRPAHAGGRQADGKPRGRKERHRQIAGLCPLERHAVSYCTRSAPTISG